MAEHNNEAGSKMMEQAQTMWKRASQIVTFEIRRNVALEVIKGHLAEYRTIPDEFLAQAVIDGVEQAGEMEGEIPKEDKSASPGIKEKAELVRDLLIEAGIIKRDLVIKAGRVKDDGNV